MSYKYEFERYKNDLEYIEKLKERNREECRFRYKKRKAQKKEQKETEKCKS